MSAGRLEDLLDGMLSPEEAHAFLASLPEAERREALALLRLADAAARLPAPAPSEDFAARAMARVRMRRPPRRSLWTWLRSPSLSPLGALAAAAAVAVGAFGLSEMRGRVEPAAVRVVARLAYRAPQAREVAVAGDFNAWKPEASPMRRGPGGVWTLEVPVAPGRRYQYMIVVDGSWVTDPSAPATVDDGFGGENAVLEL